MPEESALIALVGSRICHDLVNPLGAVGNGIELLSMTVGPSEEMQLVREAVDNTTARINFFRLAFGAADAGQTIGARNLRAILDGVSAGGRHTLKWESDADTPRRDARAAFLAILCLETALPLGGTITVRPDWTMLGTGRRINIKPAYWDPMLAGRMPEGLDGGHVQFGLLPEALRAAGRSCSLASTEDSVLLRMQEA